MIQCENLIASQVLSITLNLQHEGKPLDCFWYLYDFDSCNEMPQFTHSFFLVSNKKIQSDGIDLHTSWMNDCDQKILIPIDSNESDSLAPLWDNEIENRLADTLYYYKKFYSETEAGQKLAIRENLTLEKIKFWKKLDTKLLLSQPSTLQNLLNSINKKLKWMIVILSIILLISFF